MSAYRAIPAFGAKLNKIEYYQQVDQIIAVLRPAATLRTICTHLNEQSIPTPAGLFWNRGRLACYLQRAAK